MFFFARVLLICCMQLQGRMSQAETAQVSKRLLVKYSACGAKCCLQKQADVSRLEWQHRFHRAALHEGYGCFRSCLLSLLSRLLLKHLYPSCKGALCVSVTAEQKPGMH
jgi:hypothetical protein